MKKELEDVEVGVILFAKGRVQRLCRIDFVFEEGARLART